MTSLSRRVARNDVTLHARRLELMYLDDFGNYSPVYASLYSLDQVCIGNHVVAPDLETGIML